MIVKKVNGIIISGIIGLVISVSATMFVLWECDPSKMTESQRFVIVLMGLLGSFLGVLIYAMQKDLND